MTDTHPLMTLHGAWDLADVERVLRLLSRRYVPPLYVWASEDGIEQRSSRDQAYADVDARIRAASLHVVEPDS